MGSFQENPSCYIDHDNLQEKPMEFHGCLMFFVFFLHVFWRVDDVDMAFWWMLSELLLSLPPRPPITAQWPHTKMGMRHAVVPWMASFAQCPTGCTGHQTWLPGTSACSKEPGTLFPTFQQTVPFFRGNLRWLYWPWFMTGAEPTMPKIRRTGCLRAKSPMYSPYLPLLPWGRLKCGLHALHCWVDIQILIK